jgi:hypothetical protein
VGTVLVLVCVTGVADARIAIRRHPSYDHFSFHANYSTVPFDPSDTFTIELWNCANGAMPIFVADIEPLIVCAYDPENLFTLAELVYSVEVPGGTCVDRRRSCYYRDRDVPSRGLGLRRFKVHYATANRGNKVWLDSYGDLSPVNQANMLLVIKINDRPTATRSDTYLPLSNEGWTTR